MKGQEKYHLSERGVSVVCGKSKLTVGPGNADDYRRRIERHNINNYTSV
jgi:hypothetical protein